MPVIFITGTDTGIGKTYATGLLGRFLKDRNFSVITMKIIQTGSKKIPYDILIHRKIMNMNLTEFDMDKTTCPYVLEFPSSPHLAARKENKRIDLRIIDKCVDTLKKNFSYVLIEGIGGVYVPFDDKFTVLDYLEDKKFPVIIVTTPMLGSINHTLLTINALKSRKIKVAGIIYNKYFTEKKEIVKDTKNTICKFFPEILLVEINRKLNADFTSFLPSSDVHPI